MSARKLTEKQKLFIDEYVVSLNAADAARRAGYSEKTAQVIGAENLKKPIIRAAIETALAERAARTELRADEVIAGLRREASFTGEGSSHSARVSAWSPSRVLDFGQLALAARLANDRLDRLFVAWVFSRRRPVSGKLNLTHSAIES